MNAHHLTRTKAICILIVNLNLQVLKFEPLRIVNPADLSPFIFRVCCRGLHETPGRMILLRRLICDGQQAPKVLSRDINLVSLARCSSAWAHRQMRCRGKRLHHSPRRCQASSAVAEEAPPKLGKVDVMQQQIKVIMHSSKANHKIMQSLS